MLTPTTINFILLAIGIMFGAYLPLALIYLVSFFRRQRFGFVLIKKAAVRLAVIALLFFLILGALGFITEKFLGITEAPLTDEGAMFIGVGGGGSFCGGIILFIIGLVRGRRRVVSGSAT